MPTTKSVRARIPSQIRTDAGGTYLVDTLRIAGGVTFRPRDGNTVSLQNSEWHLPQVQIGAGVEFPAFDGVWIGLQCDAGRSAGETGMMATAVLGLQEGGENPNFRVDVGAFMRWRWIDALYGMESNLFGRTVEFSRTQGRSSSTGAFVDAVVRLRLSNPGYEVLLSPSWYLHRVLNEESQLSNWDPYLIGGAGKLREAFNHFGGTVALAMPFLSSSKLIVGVRVWYTPAFQAPSQTFVLMPVVQVDL
jgi:hypothetical protein